MKSLVELVYMPRSEWTEAIVRSAFQAALKDRYARLKDITPRRNDERRLQLRVNAQIDKDGVPYAAILPPERVYGRIT